ncbi:hypothetical protein LJB42_004278 [Komagataella kurtzmanii]|nr:hypothetical protein LJB42_004278 [Komagataella kurtzmanii]
MFKGARILIALIVCILLWSAVSYTISFFSSPSDSKVVKQVQLDTIFDNAQINGLLNNEMPNLLKVNKKLLQDFSISKPWTFDQITEKFHIRGASTMIARDKIRLVRDSPQQVGLIQSTKQLEVAKYESTSLEIDFNINFDDDAKKRLSKKLYGDGVGVWLSENELHSGAALGIDDTTFKGVAVLIDTYQNSPIASKLGKFPRVSIQYSHGGGYIYDKGQDGRSNYELGYCNLNLKYLNSPSKMRITYLKDSGYISLDFGAKKNGMPGSEWFNCFNKEGVVLPEKVYLALSSECGALHHNSDILGIEWNALTDEHGDVLSSISDLSNILNDEYIDEYVQNESENEVKERIAKQRHRRLTKDKRPEPEASERRKTAQRLRKAEERLRRQHRENNLNKYGYESRLTYFLQTVWLLLKWTFIIISFLLVGFILYNRIRKLKKKTGGFIV